MSWQRIVLSISFMLLPGVALGAGTSDVDIHGRIELSPDSAGEITADLELRDPGNGRTLETIRLIPERERPHWFKETLPNDLEQSDLLVYVVVHAPKGYVSSLPDYVRRGGKSLVFKTLQLRPSSDAYAEWIRAARDADRSNRPDLGIWRLERLEDWDLKPEQRLQITLLKAEIYAHANRWKKQQELLRDAFPGAGFQGLEKGLIADYFRARFNGFSGLIVGDFSTAVLQTSSLRDLWERLVGDFAGQYASCPLDASVTSIIEDLTPTTIAAQRKTIKSWLNRRGHTVTECEERLAISSSEEGSPASAFSSKL